MLVMEGKEESPKEVRMGRRDVFQMARVQSEMVQNERQQGGLII